MPSTRSLSWLGRGEPELRATLAASLNTPPAGHFAVLAAAAASTFCGEAYLGGKYMQPLPRIRRAPPPPS